MLKNADWINGHAGAKLVLNLLADIAHGLFTIARKHQIAFTQQDECRDAIHVKCPDQLYIFSAQSRAGVDQNQTKIALGKVSPCCRRAGSRE